MTLLRHDGTADFYKIQHQWKRSGRWTYSDVDSWVGNLPGHVLDGLPHRPDRLLDEPFFSYGANGLCWQETGIEGHYDPKLAFQIADLLSTHFPMHAFRVVHVTITQDTVVAARPEPEPQRDVPVPAPAPALPPFST